MNDFILHLRSSNGRDGASDPSIQLTIRPSFDLFVANQYARTKMGSGIRQFILCITCVICLVVGASAVRGQEPPYSEKQAKESADDAMANGDARAGAAIFQKPESACLSCHKLGEQGGTVGPDLSDVGKRLSPQEIVESVLWPQRAVRPEFTPVLVTLNDGRDLQGYAVRESDSELVLREPTTGATQSLKTKSIRRRRTLSTLMPDGLTAAMTPSQRRDLFRFLMELGRTEGLATVHHSHSPSAFPLVREPLRPQDWPNWRHFVNRQRIYDFYTKQAAYFRKQQPLPSLLEEYPGLDGGILGHWGNQTEKTWEDDRWNLTDLGSVMCGVFRGAGVTVPKAVCVRLGENGELATCFNPQTLSYKALWKDGFVKFSRTRHGFMDGIMMNGAPLPRPEDSNPQRPFVYHGFYRHGKRVIFSYRVGDVEMLDSPWVENGTFTRMVAPAKDHPLASLIRGGAPQWTQAIETRGKRGAGRPYAVDTIEPPFENPWKAPFYFGGLDFLTDGTALLCTMQGDVWRVEGLDETLDRVRWRRIASGLHQPLGLVIADDSVYVLGRDQITRLVDVNGDGETDFYECVSNAYVTSSGGHDFICGLERDAAGTFYAASSNQGLLRIRPGTEKVEVLATGFRNPDGVGLLTDGSLTVPSSEGDWTPASMICQLSLGDPTAARPFFGYGGPKAGQPPSLPLVYLPRGLDNSSGGQVAINSDKWGPLRGLAVHFSYGAGSHFLLLRDEVAGQAQGGVVPLAGEFLSGAHRGRFNPKDGQLYVCGMGGWGTYTVADGSFQRVRYTGDPVQLPVGFHAHQNGVLIRFSRPLDRQVGEDPTAHFAQCWNYRYSAAYGSPEFSTRHPDTRGHDVLKIASSHVVSDGCGLFLEIPDLQPVNQLHLQIAVGPDEARDLFLTIHQLDSDFKEFRGYRETVKTVAAHPIRADLARLKKPLPNPWKRPIANARALSVVAGSNLTFEPRVLRARPGEPLALTFTNPDVVPHNWALIKPGTLESVGELANRFIADPDAVLRHYVPPSDDVLAYSDITAPKEKAAIHFFAPAEPGRYPFLCTFPGHWKVMNGLLIVE